MKKKLSELLLAQDTNFQDKVVSETQFYNALESYFTFNKMLRGSKNFKFAYNSVKGDLARCLAIIDKYNLQGEK